MTWQRQNRIFLSHIRTPFGRTFIAHPAYREKQGKSLFLGAIAFTGRELSLGIDTNERILCRGCAWHRVRLAQNRATGAGVGASHVMEEGKAAMKMQGR